MPALIADMNADRSLAFTVFDGDVKDGSSLCTDDLYTNAIDRFNSLRAATVYVPGDNEWTDCHRTNNGGHDNLERLDHLRRTMFASADSFGQKPMTLDHQGPARRRQADPTFDLPETEDVDERAAASEAGTADGYDNFLAAPTHVRPSSGLIYTGPIVPPSGRAVLTRCGGFTRGASRQSSARGEVTRPLRVDHRTDGAAGSSEAGPTGLRLRGMRQLFLGGSTHVTAERSYAEGRSAFQREAERPLVERAFPVSRDVRSYGTSSFRRDLVAGLTVAALAIPSGMAYAEVAGLPPVVGLYTLLLPTVAYVALGSSKRLMIGPEGTTAALVGAAIAPLVADDPTRAVPAAGMLALLVGAMYLIARVVRLGWIADYFSRPVLIGYIHGVVVVLIASQLGKLTGVSIGADKPLGQIAELLGKLDEVEGLTLAIAIGSVAALLALKHWLPKVPAALTVVIAGIAASAAFDFAAHGVATVGDIPAGLPSFAWPGVGAGELGHLVPAALGIFVVSFADSILTARSFAGRHREHVRANQELAALGTASIAAGVTQGFSISASGSRTAVADDMGVRSQLAALYAAATVAVVLLLLTGPMAKLPSPCLGAVIVVAALGLVDRAAWKDLTRHSRRETAIAVVTMLGVVTVGVIQALVVAVALSIVDVVSRSARPHDAVLGYVPRLDRWADVELHPSARPREGVVVYRLDDRLFFANTNYVKARVQEAITGSPTPVGLLVFDAESVTAIDLTGLEALREIVGSVRQAGIEFALARVHTQVLEALERDGCLELIGGERVFPTVSRAVESSS